MDEQFRQKLRKTYRIHKRQGLGILTQAMLSQYLAVQQAVDKHRELGLRNSLTADVPWHSTRTCRVVLSDDCSEPCSQPESSPTHRSGHQQNKPVTVSDCQCYEIIHWTGQFARLWSHTTEPSQQPDKHWSKNCHAMQDSNNQSINQFICHEIYWNEIYMKYMWHRCYCTDRNNQAKKRLW